MNRLPPSFSYPAGDSNPYGLVGQLILSQSRLPFRHPGSKDYCATNDRFFAQTPSGALECLLNPCLGDLIGPLEGEWS